MQQEIKDIQKRITQAETSINSLEIVTDSVKGTRKDGTYGNITISGYPVPEYYRKKAALKAYQAKLICLETELLELLTSAEAFIESIPQSDLRTMFRLYYIDGYTWIQVAHRMNQMFPKRRMKYSEDGCRVRNTRFFKEIEKCSAMFA